MKREEINFYDILLGSGETDDDGAGNGVSNCKQIISRKKRVVYFCHLLVNVRNLESFLPILDCLVFPLLYTEAGGDTPIWASQCWSLPRDAGTERKCKETMLLLPFTPIHPS